MKTNLLNIHAKISHVSNETEVGNGILEMILFVPLAVLFMFVGIDLGLSFLDKAMVSDAVRETAHNQLVNRISSSGNAIYQVQANGVSINLDHVTELAQSLADRLALVIIERRVSFAKLSSDQLVKVNVTPIRISVDQKAGTILGFTKMPVLNSKTGNQALVLGPKVQNISDDEYLGSKLGSLKNDLSSENSKSIFAIPVINYSDSSTLYLSETLAFLISVEALSPSINPLFLESVLNSSLGIKIQELHVVRN